jgi:hypothetical protein
LHVFFASAVMAGIGIGVSVWFLGPYLDGGGVIHVICVGVIAVMFFYLIKGIRSSKNRP